MSNEQDKGIIILLGLKGYNVGKEFLRKIPADKVKEVCIDMKTGLKKAVEALFPGARVVVDPFHVIADANKRIDEARRIEQELHPRKIRIPKKIFLVGRERLSEEKRRRVLY